MTAVLGTVIFFGGMGLIWLAAGILLLVVAPMLLEPTMPARTYRPTPPRDGEPGWYEDPNNVGWLRYWEGRRWTNQEKSATP
jgi:hypothetical protein